MSKELYLNRLIDIKNKSKPVCPKCGKEVTKEGNLCEECGHLEARKVERPSRDLLKSLIRNKSFTQIGLDFGVTDNSVRKWCKYYNLPHRVNDIKSIKEVDWQNI